VGGDIRKVGDGQPRRPPARYCERVDVAALVDGDQHTHSGVQAQGSPLGLEVADGVLDGDPAQPFDAVRPVLPLADVQIKHGFTGGCFWTHGILQLSADRTLCRATPTLLCRGAFSGSGSQPWPRSLSVSASVSS
jgi:hypothetical protein